MHSAISNLRIALYARSSSLHQGSDSAITRQLSELRQRIAEEGGSIVSPCAFTPV